jgi:hypothetical protein
VSAEYELVAAAPDVLETLNSSQGGFSIQCPQSRKAVSSSPTDLIELSSLFAASFDVVGITLSTIEQAALLVDRRQWIIR